VTSLKHSVLGSSRGAFCGAKFAGLSPAKCPAKSPAKNIAPQKSKLGLPNSSKLLRRFLPGRIMIEMPDSDVLIEIPYSFIIKGISIMIWPGKNRRSELGGIRESRGWIFTGQCFLRGSSRGILRG